MNIHKIVNTSQIRNLYTIRTLMLVFLFMVSSQLLVSTSFAACTTCGTWYPCGNNQCCFNSGCPSYECGTCYQPNSWVWHSDEGVSRCEDANGNNQVGPDCPEACSGCSVNPPGPPKVWNYMRGFIYEDVDNNEIYEEAVDLILKAPGASACGRTNTKDIPGINTWNRGKIDGEYVYDYSHWICHNDKPMFETTKFAVDWNVGEFVDIPGVASGRKHWKLVSGRCYTDYDTDEQTCNGTGDTISWRSTDGYTYTEMRVRSLGPVPRTVTGKFYTTTNVSTCSVNTVLPNASRTATLLDGALQVGNAGIISPITGDYTINGMLSNALFTSLQGSGPYTDIAADYKLACVRTNGTSCTVDGAGNPIANCLPNNSLAGSNLTIDMGFRRVPKPRTVTGTIYESTDIANCTNNAVLPFSNLTTKLYNAVPVQVGGTANISGVNGTYSVPGLTADSRFKSLAVNGTLSNVAAEFKLACVRATNVGCNLNLGAGSVVNCAPTNALYTNNLIVNLGFQRIENDKWFTSMDGDIYAQNIVSYVSQNPSGGFSGNLINKYNNASLGGYAFTGALIDTQTALSGVAEQGGFGQELNIDATHDFTDKWLANFNFKAPANPKTNVPGNKNFKDGDVYELTVAEFNQILDGGTYNVIAANEGGTAAAIVYVTGGGTININKNFTTNDPIKQELIVVTDADVEISDTVEWSNVNTFNLDTPSQIDLNIISAGDITFNTRYNEVTNIADNPIKIHGALMAKGGVKLERDIGSVNNGLYPAENISYFPHLLYLIQKYEAQNTDVTNYTGLTTYDVQYVYRD